MTAAAITNNVVRNPMPIYKIEQYEIHTMKYRADAASEAEAIKMLFDGEADAEDNGLDYMGLPAEEHRELADQLPSLGVSVGEDLISSIRWGELA